MCSEAETESGLPKIKLPSRAQIILFDLFISLLLLIEFTAKPNDTGADISCLIILQIYLSAAGPAHMCSCFAKPLLSLLVHSNSHTIPGGSQACAKLIF